MTRIVADRYELLDRLGQGGGGIVWRARDHALDRTVAVKEVSLARTLPDDERDHLRARTLREARAAARLSHPNVVSVFDVRSDEDAVYIVMAYVAAPSLQQLVAAGGPLAPRRVAAIGLDVLAALDAAHAAGIVHRDIKPSNVLVGTDKALVTDFGIAAVSDDTALTRSGQALGTPDYVSPEQLSDDRVGPASDLWSLGATLYYAVEGLPPFRRERAVATVHAVVTAAPRPTGRAGALGPVLHDLLTKDPAQRPALDQARRRLARVAHDGTDGGATEALPASAATQRIASERTATRRLPASEGDPGGSDHARPPDRQGSRIARLAAVLAVALTVAVLVAIVLASLDGSSPDPASPVSPTPTATTPPQPTSEPTPTGPATATTPDRATTGPAPTATPEEPSTPPAPTPPPDTGPTTAPTA